MDGEYLKAGRCFNRGGECYRGEYKNGYEDFLLRSLSSGVTYMSHSCKNIAYGWMGLSLDPTIS